MEIQKEPKQSRQKAKEELQEKPLGGRIRHYANKWRKLTKDKHILQCVTGCRLNLTSTPIQNKKPSQIKFNYEAQKALDLMIEELEKDEVIEKCNFEHGDFMNNVFLVEKRSAEAVKYRCILNMKTLNKEFIEFTHFKMCTLNTCLDLMEPNCFMASLDLSNAYHTVPIHPEDKKYLKFEIRNQTYCYLTLPQGYRDSPRIFTKLLAPLLKHLRERNFISSVYIDDFYLQGADYYECKTNVLYTKALLQSLGFIISDKSVFEPTQRLEHLGFILDSVNMTVSLSERKRIKIKSLCNDILKQSHITVRLLAQLIGTLVAIFPAVEYGQLFYRELEMQKIQTLNKSQNFDKILILKDGSREEIKWWIKEGIYCNNHITHGNPEAILTTDSSMKGWGAVINNIQTQGLWSEEERKLHINALEIKAVLLGLKSLCNNMSNIHLQVQIDNTTGVTYINNRGGTRSVICNTITKDIITWCKDRNIWITACHIAGKDNIEADSLSRDLNPNIEWTLNSDEFKVLCDLYGTPEIDLFASRLNYQIKKYISYHPDPHAYAIDAFSHKWEGYVYIFPPFNLIPRVIRKLLEDGTPKALVILPEWKMATWYPKIKKMSLQEPRIMQKHKKLLHLPMDRKEIHPLYPHLKMMSCLLSGRNTKN